MNAGLKEEVKRTCAGLGIPLVGFAPADRWDTPRFDPWIPETFRPKAIFPETATVIVIGLPVSLPVLDTAPSIWYHEIYKTINSLLDQHGYRIAAALTEGNFPSVWVPRDGYGSLAVLKERPFAFFSHRHAAYLAGLGTFGVNNMLLTQKYGPRVRFASIFTSAEIPPDPVLEEHLCIRCMRCVHACPVNAIPEEMYPEGLTDKVTCATRSEELHRRHIAPCGLCIRACPVGEDRPRFNRTDLEVYRDGVPSPLRRGWEHVRAYGSR